MLFRVDYANLPFTAYRLCQILAISGRLLRKVALLGQNVGLFGSKPCITVYYDVSCVGSGKSGVWRSGKSARMAKLYDIKCRNRQNRQNWPFPGFREV